ncbi:hypothetical protein FE257_007907 [Aspergillus nanangensis]|uniref:Ketopantoate reductase C-terminal domain-containing protein n=1 Tax=Aspergillus nanangensis TaxID=2582783 RepID=A0AAD4GY09_ASPNN|nr:hypothetical protein FE257_007907 [Aspergillus nanangensis]
MRPAVSVDATIALQNGINIEAPFRALFVTNPLLSAVLYTPVSQTSPTTFADSLLDMIYLGTYTASAPTTHKAAAEYLTQALYAGVASATQIEDIQLERWKKLLINGSENSVCALCGLRDATFLQSSMGAVGFLRDVMREIAATATATAVGYEGIDEGVVEEQMELLLARALPGVMPSR